MVAAGNIVPVADRVVCQGCNRISLKIICGGVVDQGRIDGYREDTIFGLDPVLVCQDGQFPVAAGLLGQSVGNGVAFFAGIVIHIGRGDEIGDGIIAVKQYNRAVLLQRGRQVLQIQIEVKGIAAARTMQNDAFLYMIAVQLIEKINIRIYILIQHLGADTGRRRLAGEALFFGFTVNCLCASGRKGGFLHFCRIGNLPRGRSVEGNSGCCFTGSRETGRKLCVCRGIQQGHTDALGPGRRGEQETV